MTSLNKNRPNTATPANPTQAAKQTAKTRGSKQSCGCCPRRRSKSNDNDDDDANGNTATNNSKRGGSGGGKPKPASAGPCLGLTQRDKSLHPPEVYVHKDSLQSGITGLSQLSDLPRYESDSDANVDTLAPGAPKTKPKKPSTLCCLCCRKSRDQNSKKNGTPAGDGRPRGAGGPTGVGDAPKRAVTPTVKRPEGDRKRKCRRCCRKFTAFLFSHIGLSSLVVAYTVLGAFIFMNLEAKHEEKERIRMTEVRKTAVKRLWNITENLNVFFEKNWTAEADMVFLDFQDKMYHAVKWDGWDGQDASKESKWSFIGALLYSITIITTIGYGHITPKTVYGRMATIGYAIVGIPLTLLCLANLGTLFGDCFRFLYKHICHGVVWCCCPQVRGGKARLSRRMKRQLPASVAGGRNGVDGSGVAGLRSAEEGEVTYVTDDADKDIAAKENKRVRVPMVVSLLVIALYIILGAVVFSFWEEDWDIFIGAYFCFITLSTIGFGDFVPGFGEGWSKEKAVFNAFYLIFGLALIAMCFNLMQEEVRAKCAWLAKKLKLIKSSKTTPVNSPAHKGYTAVSTLSPHKQPLFPSRDRSPMSNKRDVHPKDQLSPAHVDSDDSGRSTVTVTLVRTMGSPPGVSPGSQVNGRGGRGRGDAAARGRGGAGRGVARGGGRGAGDGSAHGGGAAAPMSRTLSCSSRGGRGGGRGGVAPPGYNTISTTNPSTPQRAMTVDPEAALRALERELAAQSSAQNPPPQMVRRPKSVPVPDLEDGMNLVEQVGLMGDAPSPQDSPKMRRRDRSRSPVRGRSRTRDQSRCSARSRDKGENVDGPSGDEDDDDDTLDASSTASSTDLVKVANAIRRERDSMPSLASAVSPATTVSEDMLPAHAHPYNNAGMVTFRPAAPPAHVAACALIPTTSRPPSRCQSRARSTSPVLRTFYQQGYDVMAAASPEADTGEDECEAAEGAGSMTSGAGEEEEGSVDSRGRSAFSRPRPNSAMGSKVQKQPSQKGQKKKSNYENVMPPRCVSPMPKPMRSPSPKRMETPASLSSSTSTEFPRPPPTLPKPKNRVPANSTAQAQAF